MREYQGCCSGNPEASLDALEDGGGERWAAEEIHGAGPVEPPASCRAAHGAHRQGGSCFCLWGARM